MATAVYSVYAKGEKREGLMLRILGDKKEIIINDPTWCVIYNKEE